MKTKSFFFLLLLFTTQVLFSQKDYKKVTPKVALVLSEKYKEKARWFTYMPQYNRDSTQLYATKAITVLNPKEPTHKSRLARLQFEIIKNKCNSLSYTSQDSLLKNHAEKYLNLEIKNTENRILQYDYLVFWANVKLHKGEAKVSLELFEKALAMIDKKDTPYMQAKMLLDKGLYYGIFGLESEKKLSRKYLLQSLNYYKNHFKEYPSEYYMINAEMAYFHFSSTKPDSLYYYLNEVEKILPYHNKPLIHMWYYSMVCEKFLNENKLDEAKNCFLKSLSIIERYNFKDMSYYPNAILNLGNLAFETKSYDEAIDYFLKAYSIYDKIGVQTDEKINVLKLIANAYEAKGDLSNALKYHKQYYEESLGFEKKRNERSLREGELKVNVVNQEKEIAQKSKQQTFFIAALCLCAISLILIYRNVRLKQKSNLKLAVINNELADKNLLLDKRNADNELLLKEIHHRVKNNLEVVSGLLALQSSQIDDQSTKDAMQESQNRVNSIGIVHQKLYQGTNLGAIEMKDYVLNLSESILDSFGAEGKVKLELAMEHLDLDIDTAVPLGLIINELITNTVKYAFPNNGNGQLTLKLEKQANDILHLVVSDNGIGKSGITQGTGFGGQLISLLTQQLNGTMTEENQNGTTVIFNFKLKKTA